MSGPQRYHEILQMIHDANVRMMQQIDEVNRRRWELEDRVNSWRIAPPAREFPGVGTFRWACPSPTGHISRSPLEERWANYTRGMVDGLAGRPYAQYRQDLMLEHSLLTGRRMVHP